MGVIDDLNDRPLRPAHESDSAGTATLPQTEIANPEPSFEEKVDRALALYESLDVLRAQQNNSRRELAEAAGSTPDPTEITEHTSLQDAAFEVGANLEAVKAELDQILAEREVLERVSEIRRANFEISGAIAEYNQARATVYTDVKDLCVRLVRAINGLTESQSVDQARALEQKEELFTAFSSEYGELIDRAKRAEEKLESVEGASVRFYDTCITFDPRHPELCTNTTVDNMVRDKLLRSLSTDSIMGDGGHFAGEAISRAAHYIAREFLSRYVFHKD